MKKLILACLIVLLISNICFALRTSKPRRITDFNQNGLVIINEELESLWNITNGRYNLNIVVVNPDGVVSGNTGDILLLNSSGTYFIEVCVGGTVWRGIALQNTP